MCGMNEQGGWGNQQEDLGPVQGKGLSPGLGGGGGGGVRGGKRPGAWLRPLLSQRRLFHCKVL